MTDRQLDIFSKGLYSKIDNNFLSEGINVLQKVTKVQKKYNKPDTDTFINELRDSITGYYLGFNLINTEKHGFDCQMSDKKKIYLEVKSASFSAKTWQATFNDTNFEKAEAFKDEKLWLALSVWENASDLLFIVYGQNEKIGDFLTEKVNHFLQDNNTVRSTQSISINDLIFKYNFKILCIKQKDEIINILHLKNQKLKSIDNRILTDVKDFKGLFS